MRSYDLPVREFMDLVDAAETAVAKMRIEYMRLEPEAVLGECWAEAERLDYALDALRDRIIAINEISLP